MTYLFSTESSQNICQFSGQFCNTSLVSKTTVAAFGQLFWATSGPTTVWSSGTFLCVFRGTSVASFKMTRSRVKLDGQEVRLGSNKFSLHLDDSHSAKRRLALAGRESRCWWRHGFVGRGRGCLMVNMLTVFSDVWILIMSSQKSRIWTHFSLMIQIVNKLWDNLRNQKDLN